MKVIAGGPGDRDPLARVGGLLLTALLAFVLSVVLAALVASRVSASYTVRVSAYLFLILWTLAGSVLLFRATFRRETGPFGLRRMAVWLLSIWLWPLLLFARRRS